MKTKKLLSVLLALTMVIGMIVPLAITASANINSNEVELLGGTNEECNHEYHCDICGEDYCSHTYENAVCTKCGYLCDWCEGSVSCGDTCWNCGLTSTVENHNWVDSVCTICGESCGMCGGTPNCGLTCSVCGAESQHEEHHYVDGSCEYCGADCPTCDGSVECGETCSKCGLTSEYEAHDWVDGCCQNCWSACPTCKNHVDCGASACSTCGLTASSDTHSWVNGYCEYCGIECPECGGTATSCSESCSTCENTLSHSFENGYCSVCTAKCDVCYADPTVIHCGETCRSCGLSAAYDEHSFVDDYCEHCNASCPNCNGSPICGTTCSTCGKVSEYTAHTWENAECQNCGIDCPTCDGSIPCGETCATCGLESEYTEHDYFGGECTNCGAECPTCHNDLANCQTEACETCGLKCYHYDWTRYGTYSVCNECGYECHHHFVCGNCSEELVAEPEYDYLDLETSTTDILEKKELDQNYNLTVIEGTKTNVKKVKLSWEIRDINATRTDNRVWNTTELCWETSTSSTTINQHGTAKFTLENYSSVKVNATATFKAEGDFKGTASYDVEGGKMILDTANGNSTYSKTNVPKAVINAIVTTNENDFDNLFATAKATKYGTYTVTISEVKHTVTFTDNEESNISFDTASVEVSDGTAVIFDAETLKFTVGTTVITMTAPTGYEENGNFLCNGDFAEFPITVTEDIEIFFTTGN